MSITCYVHVFFIVNKYRQHSLAKVSDKTKRKRPLKIAEPRSPPRFCIFTSTILYIFGKLHFNFYEAQHLQQLPLFHHHANDKVR